MFSDLPKGQIASGVFFASFPSTAMFDSTKKALSLFAISVCCSASAQSLAPRFEIAGYRLGMSNAQASKIGLNACTAENIRAIRGGDHLITCTGKTPELPSMPHPNHSVEPRFVGPYLSFEPKTKRLVRIEFRALNWGDPDPRTTDLLRYLNVGSCGDQWRFEGPNGAWACAVRPDRIISVSHTGAQSFLRRTYPSHLDIVATIDKNEVSSRYALRSRNDSVAREKANRESAARKIEAGR
jgi:hypothetical protein